MEFLNCNAHFLLGLSSSCETVLKEVAKRVIWEKGHGVGRDAQPNFGRFRSSGESASTRYVRIACDVFELRGYQKNGCKQQWDTFCNKI